MTSRVASTAEFPGNYGQGEDPGSGGIRLNEATRWVYSGVWRVLSEAFLIPSDPPTLPPGAGSSVHAFRPAPGFLQYMKFQFWIVLTIIDLALVVAWLALAVASPLVGVLITPLALLVIIVPDIVAYVAIHLRYDTTWYVLSDRSLRIRRGIWVIHESTITFENIQDVTVNQGPLQRWFGIADVTVQTAGGGGGGSPNGTAGGLGIHHRGLIEGVADAAEIRDLILDRLRQSRTGGLGDDLAFAGRTPGPGWTDEQLSLLRDIHHALALLNRFPPRH
ncbi:MAG: PH domain-containing protein [Pirellulaceae bacterium]